MFRVSMCIGLLAAMTVSATAQSSVYDYRSGRSWGAEERTTERETYGTYSRDEPQQVDIYGRDGQVVDRGRVDSNGTVYSDQTGRPVGQWRP